VPEGWPTLLVGKVAVATLHRANALALLEEAPIVLIPPNKAFVGDRDHSEGRAGQEQPSNWFSIPRFVTGATSRDQDLVGSAPLASQRPTGRCLSSQPSVVRPSTEDA
jgi:hypothetical protein